MTDNDTKIIEPMTGADGSIIGVSVSERPESDYEGTCPLKCGWTDPSYHHNEDGPDWDEELFEDHIFANCPNRSAVWMKGVAHGAETLQEAISKIEATLYYLRSAEAEGWTLELPEDNGHLSLVKLPS